MYFADYIDYIVKCYIFYFKKIRNEKDLELYVGTKKK